MSKLACALGSRSKAESGVRGRGREKLSFLPPPPALPTPAYFFNEAETRWNRVETAPKTAQKQKKHTE